MSDPNDENRNIKLSFDVTSIIYIMHCSKMTSKICTILRLYFTLCKFDIRKTKITYFILPKVFLWSVFIHYQDKEIQANKNILNKEINNIHVNYHLPLILLKTIYTLLNWLYLGGKSFSYISCIWSNVKCNRIFFSKSNFFHYGMF